MQTQSTPLLSVTVLNYNYGHFLSTCLDSILKQSFKDFELILINDKSTDNSLEVIQPYLADPRIRLVDHETNKGFVASLIEGAELSRGKYISVISADDWAVSMTAFEKQITMLEADPEAVVVFTSYGYYEDEQHCFSIIRPSSVTCTRPGRTAFQELVLDRPIHHSGTIIRKTAYDAINGYDPSLRYAVDAQLWLMLCHVGKIAYINEILYAYRHHGNNMTKSKAVLCQSIREMLQIIDQSFGMLPTGDRQQLEWLYKKAVRKTLLHYTMMYTFFYDNPGLGWYYLWAAMQIRLVPTLFQKAIFSLILRTILGRRGYRLFEQSIASFRHHKDTQPATDTSQL